MTSRSKPNWLSISLVVLFFVMLGGSSLYLINLRTSDTLNISSAPTEIFPKQDCCVPSTDLKGVWSFKNSNGSTFTADVTDKAIKIHMNTNNGTSMVYWYGTFESYKPAGSVITSDVIYDDAVIMLSNSTSKNFVVGNTTLSFDFTAMGATKKVDLSRV